MIGLNFVASAALGVMRRVRERANDRLRSWQYDPPPRDGRWFARQALILGVLLGTVIWLSYRHGWQSRGARFEAERATLVQTATRQDRDRADDVQATVEAVRAENRRLADERDAANRTTESVLAEMEARARDQPPVATVPSADINAVISKVNK